MKRVTRRTFIGCFGVAGLPVALGWRNALAAKPSQENDRSSVTSLDSRQKLTINLKNISSHTSNIVVTSVPVLPGLNRLTVDGAVIQSVPVGYWPSAVLTRKKYTDVWEKHGWRNPSPLPADQKWPRRMLTFLKFDNAAPAACTLHAQAASEGAVAYAGHAANQAGASGWHVEILEEPKIKKRDDKEAHYCRDTGAMILGFGNKRLRLQFGFQNSNVNVWQWVNAQRLWSGPVAEAWQMGGLIYAGPVDRPLTMPEFARWFETAFVQEQTIMAKVFMVLYANGSAEFRAHFINNELYGHGGFVKGKPCVILESAHGVAAVDGKSGHWRLHSQDLASFGGDAPSACKRVENKLEWTPFADTRQILGIRHDKATQQEETVFVTDSEKGFAKGIARTAVFQISAGDTAPPGRCLADAHTYLLAAELSLPLDIAPSNPPRIPGFEALPELSRTAARVYLRNEMKEGFCSGGVFRYLDQYPHGRWEFSCDGNEIAAFLRGSYVWEDGQLYGLGMRNADYCADLGCHHASFFWRYHEAQPDIETYSLIYMRFGGLVQAFLETGDPYYMETAEAVANHWIATHRGNWPRRGIGRDAEPVEGILLLYDFTGRDIYFEAARQIARDVVLSLYPDGLWRSGAGAGPFWGVNALDGSPWNGSHLLAGLAEFLIRCDDNEPLKAELLDGGHRLLKMMLKMLGEMNNFHRVCGAFAWRRHYYVAQMVDDPEVRDGFQRVLQTAMHRFSTKGEGFFNKGHHCAPYIDNPWFFMGWSSKTENAGKVGSKTG
jgi:hypothetical protein